jgi:antibiotic biosynthesis monooxygenase (ABM) superfamily enzyme
MTDVRTTQLRRYRIVPGTMDDFVAWWSALLLPARVAFGFRLEGAWSVPETDEFVWTVSAAGDETAFRELDAAWAASPERAKAFEGQPQRVAESVLHLATPAS